MFARLRYKHIWPLFFLVLVVLSSCGTPDQSPAASRPAITAGEKFVALTPTPPACTKPICLNPVYIPGARPFMDTWNNIQLFQPFDYHYTPGQIATNGKAFSLVWGAGQGNPTLVPQWRASNPNIFLTYYMPLGRDAGTFNNPDLGTQRGLGYWNTVHPDWVMYQCDRQTPVREFHDPNLVLDITNPAVMAWQMQTYIQPASQAGYDAIALDNVNMDLPGGEDGDSTKMACGHYSNGQWVAQYSGQRNDPKWRSDVLNWLTKMQVALHALPHPMALVVNFNAPPLPLNDPFIQQIVTHMDAVLDESGFTTYGDKYVTDDTWQQLVQFVISVQRQNKGYFMIDEFSHPNGQGINNDQVQWALSNYLLTKYHLSSVYPAAKQDYGAARPRPEYNAPIGMPIGDIYLNQSVYWRNYSNGIVIVNPSSSSDYNITLDSASYIDLYGSPVKQDLTLAAHSGIVLLFKK